jgi:hypothetical protein
MMTEAVIMLSILITMIRTPLFQLIITTLMMIGAGNSGASGISTTPAINNKGT